jgi:hypothetical protein
MGSLVKVDQGFHLPTSTQIARVVYKTLQVFSEMEELHTSFVTNTGAVQ